MWPGREACSQFFLFDYLVSMACPVTVRLIACKFLGQSRPRCISGPGNDGIAFPSAPRPSDGVLPLQVAHCVLEAVKVDPKRCPVDVASKARAGLEVEDPCNSMNPGNVENASVASGDNDAIGLPPICCEPVQGCVGCLEVNAAE